MQRDSCIFFWTTSAFLTIESFANEDFKEDDINSSYTLDRAWTAHTKEGIDVMFSFKSKAFERFSVRFVFIVLAKGELEDQDRTGGAGFRSRKSRNSNRFILMLIEWTGKAAWRLILASVRVEDWRKLELTWELIARS